MKTIAQQLNITDFPFRIKDKKGNLIYCESSDGFRARYERDLNGKTIYYENSEGKIRANQIITVNGIKYQRIEP